MARSFLTFAVLAALLLAGVASAGRNEPQDKPGMKPPSKPEKPEPKSPPRAPNVKPSKSSPPPKPTCVVGQKNCAACDSPYGKCTACASGFYLDKECKPCKKGCTACKSEKTCTTCATGLVLTTKGECAKPKCTVKNCADTACSGATCTACKKGFALVNNTCVKCFEGCKECDTADTCKRCDDDLVLSADGTACEEPAPAPTSA